MTSNLPSLPYPEIAIAGRSNVGKSALINTLVENRKMARVSSTPGATRTINLYLCDDRFVLADLPGYGYSGVPQFLKRKWSKELDAYFRSRPNLKGCVLLLDVRHFPLKIDLEAIDWLRSIGVETLMVFTKCDKISRSEIGLLKAKIETTRLEQSIDLEYALFSARTKMGRKEVLSWIERRVKT